MKVLSTVAIALSLWMTGARALLPRTRSREDEFTSVVDILSENAEFSNFLRILQRNGDIPYLNELQNFTLLAPVNSAFVDDVEPEKCKEFNVENYILQDLVLFSSEVENGTLLIDENVRFPISLYRDSEGLVKINEATILDPDLTPNFQNATVHGISALLPDPPKIGTLITELEANRGGIHLFSSFAKGFSDFEQLNQNSTLLIPLDVNFYKKYNHIEINYILDAFNNLHSLDSSISKSWTRDRRKFIQNIICRGVYGGRNAGRKNATNLNGQLIRFNSEKLGSSLSMNDSSLSTYSNMIFDRGVAHGFTEIPFLSDSISFNAEKYLHGMNSSDFVEELYFRKLQHMVQDKSLDKDMTIFVPEVAVNERFGFAKSSLLYHFTESRLWLEDEFPARVQAPGSAKMFQSAFCSSNKRLGGNCQRLKITKSKEGYSINDKIRVLHAKPHEIGKTLIYTISEDIELPGDFLSSLNPFYGCSKSLIFLRQIGMLNLPPNNEGYTILLPCFNSWDFFDLNLEYLKKNITAVELIMKNLILEGLLYSDSSDLVLNTRNMLGENVSVTVNSPDEATAQETHFQLSTIDDVVKVEKPLDTFFNQGVIHPLKQAYFSRAVNITLKDLIQTTGTTEYLEFLEEFEDFSSIINNNEDFSILVPTASSLRMEDININSTNLRDFLKLHIIPGDSTSNLLNCDGRTNTTLGESLLCRESSPGTYLLRLGNGNDQEVRILRRGCSSFGNSSCIFLIDRPISLLWLHREKYHLKLPGVAIGVGIVVGVISVLILLFCLLVVFVGKSHSRKPAAMVAAPNDDAQHQETRPLLATENEPRPISGPSTYCQGRRFESSYSSNASVVPIDVSKTSR